MLVAEIEKLEAEAAEHALAFQKVIGERAADRSSSGRLRRLRRLRRQAEHAERERGRMHAELQSELGCGGKHTSLLATAVTTGTMMCDDAGTACDETAGASSGCGAWHARASARRGASNARGSLRYEATMPLHFVRPVLHAILHRSTHHRPVSGVPECTSAYLSVHRST